MKLHSLNEGFPEDAVEQVIFCKMDVEKGKEVLTLSPVPPPLLTVWGERWQRCLGETQASPSAPEGLCWDPAVFLGLRRAVKGKTTCTFLSTIEPSTRTMLWSRRILRG